MKGKRKKQGRQQGKEFIDAVYEGYVRHVALAKWRDVEGMVAAGTSIASALADAGRFPERGRYRRLWEDAWRAEVDEAAPGPALLGRIERAVSGAFDQEVEERRRTGARPVDEEPDFRGFVDRAFQQLFAEEAGSLEELE